MMVSQATVESKRQREYVTRHGDARERTVARQTASTLPSASLATVVPPVIGAKGAAAPLRLASQLSALPETVGLPVTPELSDVLPWPGLRPGAVVALGSESTAGLMSLLLSLMGPASQSGVWCAVAGAPHFSPRAAEHAGVSLSRMALVPDLGANPAAVIAALMDGIDVVAVRTTAALSVTHTRQLVARARKHGTVLLPFGAPWPHPDVTLGVTGTIWHGLRQGTGRLRHCELRVAVRAKGRERRAVLWPYGKPAPQQPAPSPGQTVGDGYPIDEQRHINQGVKKIAGTRRALS